MVVEVKPQKDDAHCIETETLSRHSKARAEAAVRLELVGNSQERPGEAGEP